MSDILDRLKNNVGALEAAFPQSDTAQLEYDAHIAIEELRSGLASYKADAIRLLGEKVKAEKERDDALKALKALRQVVMSEPFTLEQSFQKSVNIAYADQVIAEIERG